MKLTKTAIGMEINDIPKTVRGMISATVTPVVLGCILTDWLLSGESLSESWYIPVEAGVILAIYLWWICTRFRTRVLTYAFVFDRNGVHERRLMGRGRHIRWEDVEEYTCVYVGHRDKTTTRLFCIEFVSSRADAPTIIRTPDFPEEQMPTYRDELFAFCDAMRKGYPSGYGEANDLRRPGHFHKT